MPTYNYTALNSSGKEVAGTMHADTPRHCRQLLREKGLMPISAESSISQSKASLLGSLKSKRKIKSSELVLGIRQVSTMFGAGIPLAECLIRASEQTESKNLKLLFSELYSQVVEGFSLSKAVENSSFKINPEIVATIKAGEETGHLESVLSQMSDSMEIQERLGKKVRSALTYPAIMVLVSLAIVIFLLSFVVPQVVGVFERSDRPLPALTLGLINTSEFLQANFILLILLGVAAFIGAKYALKNPYRLEKVQLFLLKLPVIGLFLSYSALAKWSRTLGILVSSGVPLKAALGLSAKSTSILPYQTRIESIEDRVRSGGSLGSGLQEAGLFPGLLISLVQTGEGSGQLGAMLKKSADHYESELDNASNTLVSLLEPALIVIMGGVVLTIVLAIMLPIFQMNQVVG